MFYLLLFLILIRGSLAVMKLVQVPVQVPVPVQVLEKAAGLHCAGSFLRKCIREHYPILARHKTYTWSKTAIVIAAR